MAGDAAAHGADTVDSAEFRHIRVPGPGRNAKYVTISVKQFAKPRVARPTWHGMRRGGNAGRGKRPAAFEGDAGRTPRRYGDVPADARYRVVENRRGVKDSGCRRMIEPRADCTIEGEDAWAGTLGFLE